MLRTLCAISLLVIVGCSTAIKDTSTPEGAFAAAEEYEKDEMYEESLQKFSEVKNRFPYSRFATEAELRIADIHFKREAWIEAQNNYQLFKDLHPKHAKISYVTYRLGMSYFNQLPATIDRDLSVAEKAISTFDELTTNFKDSEYVKEALEKRAEARQMMGEKVLYIADFYFIRDWFDSALLRYETLTKEFSKEGFGAKGLLRSAISAMEIGDRAKGTQYFNELQKQYANSQEATDGIKAMEKYGLR